MAPERSVDEIHCLEPVELANPLKSEEHIRLLLLAPPKTPRDEHESYNETSALCCTVWQARLSDLLVLNDDPAFAALSYRWGSAAKSATIDCGEHRMPITENLFQALAASRYLEEPRLIWADALCIDQDNSAEKSIQVRRMGDIYRQAHVIIWLGLPFDWEADKAILAFIELLTEVRLHFPDYYKTKIPKGWVYEVARGAARYHGFKTLEDLPWVGLYAFFSNPYFRRLWIIQEVIHAWSNEVRFPKVALLLEHLLAAIQMTIEMEDVAHGALFAAYADEPVVLRNLLEGYNAAAKLLMRTASLLEDRGPFVKWSNGAIVAQYSDHECFDRRDMIYGLISLFNKSTASASPYAVDYDLATAEVYVDFAMHCLQSDNALTLLSQSCRQSFFRCPEKVAGEKGREWTPGLPSWCPDWAGPAHPAIEHMEYSNLANTTWQASGERAPVWSCLSRTTLGLVGIRVCKIIHHCATHSFLGDDSREKLSMMEDLVLGLRSSKPAKELCTAYYHVLLESNQSGEAGRLRKLGPRASNDDASYEELLQYLGPLWLGLYAKRLAAEAGIVLNMSGSRSKKLKLANELQFRSYLNLLGLNLFVTDTGLLGTGPNSLDVGDDICVLYGGRVPYVMRPRADGSHCTFLGEAHVYGLMRGEALDMGISAQEFRLV